MSKLTCVSDDLSNMGRYADDIVDIVRECLVVLGTDRRVRSTNRAFQRSFQLEAKASVGKHLEDLGRPELAAMALSELRDGLDGNAVLENVRVEVETAGGEPRAFVVNARRIGGTELSLVALDEVTASEKKIRTFQSQLQRMAFDLALTEERERRRLAVELHDQIGQNLALARIKLKSVRHDVTGATGEIIDAAAGVLDQAIADARTLIFELSPPILYDLGLHAALDWLAEDVERRHKLTVAVTDDGADKPLDDATKALVFRAVRELLMNVLKHAKAPSASVTLHRAEDFLKVAVKDDGIGFDPRAVSDDANRAGFGLLSVREQMARLLGTVEVASAPMKGTVVTITVPLQLERRLDK